tara:strand:+ start:79 stop:1053 length:975 start_codon:yes stop_codon:yes gene_type:complete
MIPYKKMDTLDSMNQLKLYGYNDYFNSFKTLYNNKKLPSVIMLSGPKGMGKATFAYHFINYLLSKDENIKYSFENFEINENNSAFKLMQNNTHPNFFLLDNKSSEEDIKIDTTKKLIQFLSKSTYSKNLKIVLIDNSEFLNISSSNALLKSLEEPPNNTFIFIINNTSSKILNTIKSRSLEFKLHFNDDEKKNIFIELIKYYNLEVDSEEVFNKYIHYETPGNLLRYLIILSTFKPKPPTDPLSNIFYLIDKYKSKNDPFLLNFIALFIEYFYNNLSINNSNNLNIYFMNKYKILNLINNMKKFNLDKKNLLISIKTILENEKR